MSAHTPGPWTWINTSWEYNHIYAGRKLCATIHIDADVTEETEDACVKVMNANARLIASAPDLLEALTRLVAAVHRHEMANAHAVSHGDEMHHAEVAIAKATGAA